MGNSQRRDRRQKKKIAFEPIQLTSTNRILIPHVFVFNQTVSAPLLLSLFPRLPRRASSHPAPRFRVAIFIRFTLAGLKKKKGAGRSLVFSHFGNHMASINFKVYIKKRQKETKRMWIEEIQMRQVKRQKSSRKIINRCNPVLSVLGPKTTTKLY